MLQNKNELFLYIHLQIISDSPMLNRAGLYHQLVLRGVTKGLLSEMAGFVEIVRRLSHGTPGAFFYADYRDGGGSLTCLRDTISAVMINRIKGMASSSDLVIRELYHTLELQSLLRKARSMLVHTDGLVPDKLSFMLYMAPSAI